MKFACIVDKKDFFSKLPSPLLGVYKKNKHDRKIQMGNIFIACMTYFKNCSQTLRFWIALMKSFGCETAARCIGFGLLQ